MTIKELREILFEINKQSDSIKKLREKLFNVNHTEQNQNAIEIIKKYKI